MRVLMLGGTRDEVVPCSQMQELWAIIRSRGRARDVEKPGSLCASSTTKTAVSTGEKAKARRKRVDNDDDGDDGPGPDGAKVPPRVVTDGGNTYIEFSAGMHSECFLFSLVRGAEVSFARALKKKRRYVRTTRELVRGGPVCRESEPRDRRLGDAVSLTHAYILYPASPPPSPAASPSLPIRLYACVLPLRTKAKHGCPSLAPCCTRGNHASDLMRLQNKNEDVHSTLQFLLSVQYSLSLDMCVTQRRKRKRNRATQGIRYRKQ